MKHAQHPKLILVASVLLLFGVATVLHAQVFSTTSSATTSSSFTARDPGVRGGAAGAGGPIAGLTPRQTDFFLAGQTEFKAAEAGDGGPRPREKLEPAGG